MKPEEPGLVKLIVGILYSDGALMEKGLSLLSERYGPVDYRSPAFPFSQTDYYVPEMGSPISRIFVSHERLIHPKELSRIKVETNEMEDTLAENPGVVQKEKIPFTLSLSKRDKSDICRSCFDRLSTSGSDISTTPGLKRKVNLDPGTMDYDKFVLASAKYNGQKIYLDRGIWADLTLHYEKGKFDPYPWSFPDFKSRMYDGAFMEMRRLYKDQRKND